MAEPPIEVRIAQTDTDVVAIHRFLCVVAGPLLPGPIDGKASATEVWRVVNDDAALMAIRGDVLVGTIGLVQPTYWWNPKLKFLANRWLFALPGTGAGALLVKEAIAIARGSGLALHIYDETRQRLKIFNAMGESQHVLRQSDPEDGELDHLGSAVVDVGGSEQPELCE